jgi:lysophospholipase
MRWEYIRAAPHQNGKFQVCTTLSRNVTAARLFPGMSMDVLAKFFEPPVQGVVLQTYGAGNAPTTKSFLSNDAEAPLKIPEVSR